MKSKSKIRPKDMTPKQLREHNNRLGRVRNRRHYARVRKDSLKNGGTQLRRWRVVSYDENGKIQSLNIRKGIFIITFD
jgi:hypothetical protein